MDRANQSFNISFDTYISMDPDRTSDGIVTNDQTFDLDCPVNLEKLKNDEIKEWAQRAEDERDQFLLDTMKPIFEIASRKSGKTEIAQAIFKSSALKTQLSDFITECEKEVSAIDEIMQTSAREIELIPFSSVKQGVMDRLGVVTHDISQKFEKEVVEPQTGFTRGAQSNPLVQYLSGDKANMTFLRWLDITITFTPHTIEASSRKIIDMTLLGLADALMTQAQTEQIQAPELKVHSPCKTHNRPTVWFPVPAAHNVDSTSTDAIVFTGSIDYAIVTVSKQANLKGMRGQQAPEAVERPFVSNDMDGLLRRLGKNYDVEGLIDGLGDRGHNFHILFVEAKRAALDPSESTKSPKSPETIEKALKWLSKYEPQVVAETMVGIKHLENRRKLDLVGQSAPNISRPLYLPWCLSDGMHWIFGAVLYRPHPDHGKWFNFRLAEAVNDRCPGSINLPTSQLTRLMNFLFLLCSKHLDVFFEGVNRDLEHVLSQV